MRVSLQRRIVGGGWRCPTVKESVGGALKSLPRIPRSFSTVSRENFFADEMANFDAFKLDPALDKALKQAGFRHPSKIQSLGMSPLMAGSNAVLAAETGSGKTLAYLLPIMTQILAEKQTNPKPATLPSFASEPLSLFDLDEDEPSLPPPPPPPPQRRSSRYAWVLCPSVDLCQQIQSVIQTLSTTAIPPLITSEISPAGLSRYTVRPDILLGTPSSLVSTLVDMERSIRHRMMDKVGYVVIDEADLMLSGSYRSEIDRLFEMLKMREREVAARCLSRELQITPEEFMSIKKHIRKAGISKGFSGMIQAGYSPENSVSENAERPSWKRQYIFAGATILSLGKKNARNDILELSPDAEMISTADLHKAAVNVRFDWKRITSEERLETLAQAIRDDPTFELGTRGKILIFTNSVNAAVSTERFLQECDIPCISFHKKQIAALRRSHLNRFREDKGVVMVSTDGMSRGMDVENISHVIQSEFAQSAIAFVHRVGRTARAGKEGQVTSLWTEDDRILVEAIRDCTDSGKPIEGIFSRNRSFRHKFRRYGVVIPRGMPPPSSATKPSDDSCKDVTSS